MWRPLKGWENHQLLFEQFWCFHWYFRTMSAHLAVYAHVTIPNFNVRSFPEGFCEIVKKSIGIFWLYYDIFEFVACSLFDPKPFVCEWRNKTKTHSKARIISSSYIFAEILFSNLKNSDVNFLLFVWKYIFFNIAAHLFAFSPIFSSETSIT